MKFDIASRLIFWGWTGFIAENLVLSHNRSAIIEELGDKNYHRIYNTLSTASCLTILYGFYRGKKLTSPNTIHGLNKFNGTRAGKILGMGIRVIGLGIGSQTFPKLQFPWEIHYGASQKDQSEINSQAIQHLTVKSKCPIEFGSDRDGETAISKKITRHPMLWTLGLTSLSFIFRSTYMHQVIFFGYPIIFTIIGGLHQDYRHLRGLGGILTEKDYENSSHVPFWAILNDKLRIDLKDVKWINLGLATLIGVLI
jgi:hypothetical protein